jgi:hypothetical protein
MLAEYVDHALQFEHMAADEANPGLKAKFLAQATDYRKLAAKRAVVLGLAYPPSKGSG